MLLCQHHDSKRKWRSETLKQLRITCKRLNTHIDLQTVLLECTHLWLNGKTFHPNSFPSHLIKLLEDQSEIGWDQVFCGRFCSEWARIQGRHYKATGAAAKLSGDSWTASVASTPFGCWAAMWKARCDLTHGHDDQARHKIERERAIRELKLLCNAKTSVPFLKRTIFPDMATMLAAPTNTIQDWIALHGQMIRNYVVAKARRRGTPTRAIWEFYQQLNLEMLPVMALSTTTPTPPDSNAPDMTTTTPIDSNMPDTTLTTNTTDTNNTPNPSPLQDDTMTCLVGLRRAIRFRGAQINAVLDRGRTRLRRRMNSRERCNNCDRRTKM